MDNVALFCVDRELVMDRPGDAACKACLPGSSGFEVVTQIHVVRARGLRRKDGDKGQHPNHAVSPLTRRVHKNLAFYRNFRRFTS